MRRCANCGKTIKVDYEYCPSCGAPLSAGHTAKEEKGEKKRYAGELRKCPSCGNALGGFDVVCKACGYEIQGVKQEGAVWDFSRRIQTLELTRGGDYSENKAIDEKILTLIKTFPIPNTKRDVLEFMMLAYSNIDAEAIGKIKFMLGSGLIDRKETERVRQLSNAWIVKIKQTYEQAKLTFGEDDDFNKINAVYLDAIKISKKVRGKLFLRKHGPLLALIGLFIILSIINGVRSSVESYVDSKEKEQAIADGKISVGFDYWDLTLENYKYVEELLRGRGFTNIHLIEIGDGTSNDKGKVKSISIDGNQNFRDDDFFYPDDKIVISYH